MVARRSIPKPTLRPLRLEGLQHDVLVTDEPRVIRTAIQAFLKRDEPILFDTETTGLDPRRNKLITLQLRQPSSGVTLIVDWRSGLAKGAHGFLQQLFNERVIIGHNLKFDAEFLLAQGLFLKSVFDTMLAEQLLGGDDVSLAGTLKRRFGRDMSKLERTWFYQPAPLDERPDEWDAPLPLDEVRYAALDVEVLSDLFNEQREALTLNKLNRVARIEMRALPAIAAMEMQGVRVEQDGWRAFIGTQAEAARTHADEALSVLGPHIMAERIETYDAAREAIGEWERALADEQVVARREWQEYTEQKLTAQPWGEWKREWVAKWRAAHPRPTTAKLDLEPPNIGSQKQLIAALKRLRITVPTKRNDKGETVETTDSENLERLAPAHPVIRSVLQARKAQKFVDSFGEKLLAFADERGRIHPDYHQIGADTGRMSCSKPNWQQVPARGEGAALRKCVIADQGFKLITADFSNIELRIIADLSGDEQMLAMFASGEDLHSYTARLMFGLNNEVDPKKTEWRSGLTYRQAAKIVNYLIPYGGSAFAIAMQNNMPVEDAEDLVSKWFGMFPGVRRWMDKNQREIHKTMKSVTASGRMRRYLEPKEPVYGDREGMREYKKQWAAIERQARNSPVQGLSADITKLAVANFHEACDIRVGCLVAVVHDEMVVEAPERHATVVSDILAKAMDDAAHAYLKRVALPYPEPTISEHWEHD